jgi:DNA-binding NarL/FixJ family response regulator
MVALRPPPRRHLSSAFDQDTVGGPHKHPETGVGGATATIVVDAHPAFCAGVAQLLDDLRDAVNAMPQRARFAVFANDTRRATVLAALELGASGYLLKNIRGATLSKTLRTIMDGARADDESLAAMIEEYLARRAARRGYLVLPGGKRVAVSPREQQVADLLTEGASTRTIAEELGVSVVTVRRHVSALMRKLDVANRDGMIRLLAA